MAKKSKPKNLPMSVMNRNRRKDYAQKKENKVTIGDSYRITNIFTKNGWIDYPHNRVILTKYTQLIGDLNNDQKDLFLDLTSRFLWKQNYTPEIIEQLNLILKKYNSNCNNFYVLRCVKKHEEQKPKSSGMVLYMIKNPVVNESLEKEVVTIDRFKDLNDTHKKIDFKSSLFILVDDFVGTGDTAVDCMKYLKSQHKEMEGRMVIMCVAALEQGIQRLNGIGVEVFAAYRQKRGITDFYTGDTLDRNRRLMEEIEEKLQVSDDYKFGYGRSEALVCLIRCPNNTFPIYWHASKSPYPRHRV